MDLAIKLEFLSKIYKLKNNQEFKAVNNLNLDIEKGQVIGFLGPNGAGKTTTIKMICNLIKPTQGNITLNGFDLKKNTFEALSQIGAVLEGARNIFWQLTPKQNLQYFGQLKGQFGQKLKNQIEKLLKELDLFDRKDTPVNEFSRGLQQKVAIACALIADPPIILLDEPTLGLDVQASRSIKNWINHMAQNEKKTIVLTTHQLDLAEQVCQRIAIINKGEIVTDKSTEDLLKLFNKEIYQIAVHGKIDKKNILPGMEIIEKDNQTIFSGSIIDKIELHNTLSVIKNHNLDLISINKVKHNLEEIFIKLMQD